MSDYITEDLQLKILKHLPVMTLLRFRCVCKWWKQTIESQPFIEEHLALQKRCLIVETQHKLPSLDIIIAPTPERLHLVGTLHGIICFYNHIQYNFLVWNPSIRRFITVKGGQSSDWDLYIRGEYVIDCCCGFWIDPLTKDFKIIVFLLFDDLQEDGVYWVYSSSRGDWEEGPIGDDMELYFYYTKEVAPAVVMGRVGYWVAYYDKYDADNEEEKMVGVVVVSFDFVSESFLEPIFALNVKDGWNLPVLCDHDGDLSLVYIDPERGSDIFVRKEDKWVNVDGLLLFPFVERCVWGMVEVEDKDKNNVMVLATTSDELLMFDNSDPKALACTWAPLMTEIKDSNVVVANGFVESLLFPEAGVL